MKIIGVELNHVIRNVNRQLAKYYQKEFNYYFDEDEIDEDDNVLAKLHFRNKAEMKKFIYTDYPYEIFGCATTTEANLASHVIQWVYDATNVGDGDDVRIIFYSLNEAELAMQSTLFFLSKIGSRVRKVVFPESVDEVWKECDIVITANRDFLTKDKPEGKKVVLVTKKFNEDLKEKADHSYGSMMEIIEDNNFFNKVLDDGQEGSE